MNTTYNLLRLIINAGFSTALLCACQSQSLYRAHGAPPQINDTDFILMPGINIKNRYNPLLKNESINFEELVACATKKNRFIREQEVLAGKEAEINSRGQDLESERNTLATQQPTVDPQNKPQVDDFNHRLADYEKRLTAYNAEKSNYNDLLKALDGLKIEFNSTCANRSYRQSDLSQLSPELIKAVQTYYQVPEKSRVK